MKTEKFITADGSHTLFVPQINEHYHSVNGAVQKSEHIFIEAGLRWLNTPIIYDRVFPLSRISSIMRTSLPSIDSFKSFKILT